jgi:putative glutamine amidotransferase
MYEVNSYHNYGIKTATKELEVIAKTDDGIIEAVCHKKYPIYAIMWHPEREKNFNKNDIKFCNLIFGG